LGSCGSIPLVHHTEQAVFDAQSPGITELTDILENSCGYKLSDGYYFNVGVVYSYDASNFYSIVKAQIEDRTETISYDASGLFIAAESKVLSESVSLTKNYTVDYAAQNVASVSDENGNITSFSYDAFGALRTVSYGEAKVRPPFPEKMADVINAPEKYLIDGVDIFIYTDRSAWSRDGSYPGEIKLVSRGDGKYIMSAVVTDGFSRDNGSAIKDDTAWIISG
jgi:YD repeat-containing protein